MKLAIPLRFSILQILLACLLVFGCHDAAGLAPPAPASPATEIPRIPAKDVVTLRKHLGKQVTVLGHVQRTAKSNSGLQFLNFANSEVTAICFSEDVAKFKDGSPADLYRDQDVEVSGSLELYKGKLQIRIDDPSQVKITKLTEPKPVGVELKKIGTDTWLSPGGLRYQGRDPMGLTRVEHVARHTQDVPSRDGPHGVFDGGDKVAFAVIDEAWKTAGKKGIRPVVEGDRSSYTVSMGRRVGFLGGKLGASQKNPPLSRVFIVFESGTNNIITAFPK